MMDSNDKVRDVLNELLEICRDGEQGYRAAAERVSDPRLKRLFSTYSEQRAQFAVALGTEVRRLGGDPERDGSVTGSLHRGWMSGRSAALSGGEARSILAEVERGEDAAKAAYERALRETTLPPSVRAIVQRQLARVWETHEQVRGLRDRAA